MCRAVSLVYLGPVEVELHWIAATVTVLLEEFAPCKFTIATY